MCPDGLPSNHTNTTDWFVGIKCQSSWKLLIMEPVFFWGDPQVVTVCTDIYFSCDWQHFHVWPVTAVKYMTIHQLLFTSLGQNRITVTIPIQGDPRVLI